MVLKLSIRIFASPWQQRFHWGLRVTQDAYFSLMTHTKLHLLVTFFKPLQERASFRTADGQQTDGGQNAEGQTDVEVEIVI